MNREIWNRLKMAGEYQKKAIYALFPEKVSRHLDVIETELKMMAVEIAADVVRECRKCDGSSAGQDDKKEPEVKKVDIV
ncbi:MAG: hypothetical protein K2G51_11110 [Lachnospiraceae bacterium]|nr:hypothetical protein [Lachnospiraceae bacterium]MDE7273918.1 hypothetical protein [Lachnospiraceae bacterium]